MPRPSGRVRDDPLGDRIRREGANIAEDVARFDVAIGPAYVALIYFLFAFFGAYTGVRLASLLGSACLLPLFTVGGMVGGIILATWLRRRHAFGRQLGIVGLLFAFMVICMFTTNIIGAKEARSIEFSQYDSCVAQREMQGGDVSLGCAKILARGDPRDPAHQGTFALVSTGSLAVTILVSVGLLFVFLHLTGPVRRTVQDESHVVTD